MKELTFLTFDEVLQIHQNQISRYGGKAGIRDTGLLSSALAVPASTYGGDYLHRNVVEMAAAYLFHIVKDHPFADGNKRTGAACALVFLDLNGVDLEMSQDALAQLVENIASGKVGKATAATMLRAAARPARPEEE